MKRRTMPLRVATKPALASATCTLALPPWLLKQMHPTGSSLCWIIGYRIHLKLPCVVRLCLCLSLYSNKVGDLDATHSDVCSSPDTTPCYLPFVFCSITGYHIPASMPSVLCLFPSSSKGVIMMLPSFNMVLCMTTVVWYHLVGQ